jgi:UDP-N-acetylmuramate dehydrogenase
MQPPVEHAPLAPHSTLRIGGPARYLVEAADEATVADAVTWAAARRLPVRVLGGGSNLVIADEGVEGLVVKIGLRGVSTRDLPGAVEVTAAAGESWDGLVQHTVERGWAGLECLSGIPGLVGATPIQNVGAYGQEVSETIASVRVYDRAAGAFVDMPAGDCRFVYRSSVFKGSDRWIVTRVRFVLELGSAGVVRYPELARALDLPEGGRAPLRQLRETVIALRRAKGMVLDPNDPESVSAGSFFVNPIVDAATLSDVSARAGAPPPSFDAGGGRHKIAAAWLVERAGFVKGSGDGRVGISRKHALALVHRGGGTTSELVALARSIRDRVRDRFGVALAPEPVPVGFSWEEAGL